MFGKLEKICFLLLLAYALLLMADVAASVRTLVGLASIVVVFLVLLRFARLAIRKSIWSLRHRLYVAYLFIAVVPVTLILGLAATGGYLLTGQLATYLVSAELERRTEALHNTARFLTRLEPENRPEWVRRSGPLLRERFPGLQILVRDNSEWRYPDDASISPPRAGWGDIHGIVLKDGLAYAWAHVRGSNAEVTALVPLTRGLLSGLVPDFGQMNLLPASAGPEFLLHRDTEQRRRLPDAANRFDVEVLSGTAIPIAIWDSAGRFENGLLSIRSRASTVLNAVLAAKVDPARNLFAVAFFTVAALLLIAEVISLVIGVSLTRTITAAVENLYEGTERVMEGDFSHRIEVQGKDQLGELGRSFNRMTENLERLVVVEKEKERLHSELEIASEVQNQLFPRAAPDLRTLRLTAVCRPARMVSGDYYDYQLIDGAMLALAIGDVAGKGISAALLMATVQAVLRTQIRGCVEAAAAVGHTSAGKLVSTSRLVSQLNQQLHAHTSPEKFATFCFGVYDDQSGLLTYTNAGHLPPILLRDGEAQRLDVNGMVIGAFPFAQYDESRVQMKDGDMLVFYTDGITEPENEYGEMFGEDRLIEVLQKNIDCHADLIVDRVMKAVHQWTGSEELQDDMTMLLASKR